MPRSVKGRQKSAIPQIQEDGLVDRYGVHALTRVEMVPVNLFAESLRQVGSLHPTWPAMAVSQVRWERTEQSAGAFYRISYIYEGFIGFLPEPSYELNGALSEEPIETNKNFETFAGTPSAPKNGAVFVDPDTGKRTSNDAVGVFSCFSSGDLAGVASYAAPGCTWTMIYYETSPPANLKDMGKIDQPSGPAPRWSGRNWLLWDVSYRKRGFIYEVRLIWRLSGRKGWNKKIYA